MTLLSRFRKPVDKFAPRAGHLYRLMRDVVAEGAARQTKYGFTLAGGSLMTSEKFEPHEARIFIELLKSHEIVVDVGANVGFYSCLAASYGKHILAFEPSARNLKFLYRNLQANGVERVEVFPMGLAQRPGLSRLYGFGGIASFVSGWAQARESKFEVVPITSLDTILAGRFAGLKLLIKIDVEGFELDVLSGAEKTLSLSPKPTWLVEISSGGDVWPVGTNARFAEVFEIFWKRGYRCRALDANLGLVSRADVQRWVAAGAVDNGIQDFLFEE